MKKKSPRQKGNEYQGYLAEWLFSRGWVVHNQRSVAVPKKITDKTTGDSRTFWSVQRKDVFGSDLIAKKGERTLYIAASLDTGIEKRKERFKYLILKREGKEVKIPIPWAEDDEILLIIKRSSSLHDVFKYLPASSEFVKVGRISRRDFYYTESTTIFLGFNRKE